jgi:hypothetical protein
MASGDASSAAHDLGDSLVIVNDDSIKKIKELVSGESGLPFHAANVELERALTSHSQQNPMRLSDLISQLQSIMEKHRMQALAEVDGAQVDGVRSSLEYLAEPRNSYVVRMKNETFASIRTSYDMLLTELRQKYGNTFNVTAWECVEGPDRMLCDQFAQLCAYNLSHSRTFSSSTSIYVGATATRNNNVMLRIALDKAVRRVIEAKRKDPSPLPASNLDRMPQMRAWRTR